MAGTNDQFGSLQIKSPLLLRTSIKESELDKAKITITYADGTSKKPMQPMTHGKSKEETLFCINAFMQNCDQYELDNGERFEYFPMCLGALLYPTWTTAQQGEARTNAGFRRSITKFLKALQFHDDSVNDLTEYLDTVKKPHGMSVAELMARLKAISMYAALLPEGSEYTAAQLKKKYYRMMPVQWQTQYRCHNPRYQTDANTSIEDMAQYFSILEASQQQHMKGGLRGGSKARSFSTVSRPESAYQQTQASRRPKQTPRFQDASKRRLQISCIPQEQQSQMEGLRIQSSVRQIQAPTARLFRSQPRSSVSSKRHPSWWSWLSTGSIWYSNRVLSCWQQRRSFSISAVSSDPIIYNGSSSATDNSSSPLAKLTIIDPAKGNSLV